MVQTEMSKSANQNVGMPSALLTDVRPSSETSNTVQYKITPTIIHQIFIENPEVEKLYKEMVPDKVLVEHCSSKQKSCQNKISGRSILKHFIFTEMVLQIRSQYR